MDANGLRFWMLADLSHWDEASFQDVTYDAARRSLRLKSERKLPPQLPSTNATDLRSEAIDRLAQVPQALDSYGTRAWWDAPIHSIRAAGAFPTSLSIWDAPDGHLLTDMAMGYDGVLYLVLDDGSIVLVDLRQRWDPVTLQAEDFTAWRIAADPQGGVWALDRNRRLLANVEGMPLPLRPLGSYSSQTFRPCPENPHPPRLTVLTNATWESADAIAIACNSSGQVAVLTWETLRGWGQIRLLKDDRIAAPVTLNEALFPYSLKWVNDQQVAVLLPGLSHEAPVFAVRDFATLEPIDPVGDLYPLRNFAPGPFAQTLSLPPQYPITPTTIPPTTETIPATAPLYHLSLPSFAAVGMARNAPGSFDSGGEQTIWHRLYLEADIPSHCGIRVFLIATDSQAPPGNDTHWSEHRFGQKYAPTDSTAVPRGVWLEMASEIPFHPGLMPCSHKKNQAGLFTALIQRSTSRVRNLQGRYLHIRIEMEGDQRTSPELFALRAYASRFSYLNRYLPELYRETLFGAEAEEPTASGTPSTAPDFLERFLDIFEGVLTPLEDRIAASWIVTDPRVTSEDALEWLGSWIGIFFDPVWPRERRRLLLENAPELFRQRGTLGGLRLALDLATGGAVSGGEIIVLENFRLRRTFATILGADLADETDPLLGGLAVSGNSFVGDTLFLGEESRKEFLALFAADLAKSSEEKDAVRALYDRLAYRVTVLVHSEIEPQDLGLIRRITELETPAHVEAKILTASVPFIVGMASLVGVDSYLARKPKPSAVRVEQSRIGVRDLIQRPPSLDPRLESGSPLRLSKPIARITAPSEVRVGETFKLDGSKSSASAGHKIVKYIWKLEPPPG